MDKEDTMSDKDLLLKEKLEHNGLIDYPGLYSYASKWFRDEQYLIIEENYNEKVSTNARDINFTWRVTRRISDYFKIEIELKFFVFGLTEVEVEQDGKKKKTGKGRFLLEMKSFLVRDPDSKWDASATLRFFRDIYSKYVVPKRIEGLEEKLIYDSKAFKDALKSYLDMIGPTG